MAVHTECVQYSAKYHQKKTLFSKNIIISLGNF